MENAEFERKDMTSTQSPAAMTILQRVAGRQKLLAFSCILPICALFLFFAPGSYGQMSQLVPLVTDQTPMGLSPNFGVPASRVVNQNGDYAFVGEGNTAVFFLSHNASSGTSPTLVLQYGNEFPGFACNPTGFPGSRITSLANVQLNDNGLIAFQAAGDLANGQFFSIILSYNGTCFQDLVDSSMVAPGTGGA